MGRLIYDVFNKILGFAGLDIIENVWRKNKWMKKY